MNPNLLLEILIFATVAAFVIFTLNWKNYLKQKAGEYNSTLFQRYLIIAESIVETTVIRLNETVVRDLKKSKEDGKITREEGIEILTNATATIKSILGENFLGLISNHIGNLDEWIIQEIEKYVALNKDDCRLKDLYEDLKDNNLIK